jgi:hypothetical protein|tara:strand:- start:225 stop:542 length:318 start_codon:yes stop_codon:yes gene_type:complete
MSVYFAKVWESGLVRFPDEKPVFGEVKNGLFYKWIEIIPKSVDGINDRITIVKSTEPNELDKGTLVDPKIIRKYKNKFNCLKAFVGANQDMANRVHAEINKKIKK